MIPTICQNAAGGLLSQLSRFGGTDLRQHATTIHYQRKKPARLVTAGFVVDPACRAAQPQALAASMASLSMRDE